MERKAIRPVTKTIEDKLEDLVFQALVDLSNEANEMLKKESCSDVRLVDLQNQLRVYMKETAGFVWDQKMMRPDTLSITKGKRKMTDKGYTRDNYSIFDDVDPAPDGTHFPQANMLYRKCLLRVAKRRGMDIRKCYPRERDFVDYFSWEMSKEAYDIFLKRVKDNPDYWKRLFSRMQSWKWIRCVAHDREKYNSSWSLEDEIENVILYFHQPRFSDFDVGRGIFGLDLKDL